MSGKPDERATSEPSGGGHEGNANVHVDIKPEFKKRPEQYPDAGEQLDRDRVVAPEKSK